MLRRLEFGDKRGEAHKQRIVRVIVVPAYGFDRAEDWRRSSDAWLQKLASDFKDCLEVWQFVTVKETQSSVIQRTLDAAQLLLETANYDYERADAIQHPLLFVCHGLGGLTVQKTLCLARNHWYQYKQLIDSICGAVFLGVPNLIRDVKQTQYVLQSMLDCQEKRPGKLPITAQDVQDVNTLSESFELLPIHFPVLSCYETLPTKMRKKLFAKFRKPEETIIASERICGFGKIQESLLGAAANHTDILKLDSSGPQYKFIHSLVDKVLNSTSPGIEESSENYTAPPGLQKLSLRSMTVTEAPDYVPPRVSSSGQSHDATNDPSSLNVTSGSTDGSFTIIDLQTTFEPTTRELKLPCFSMGTQKSKQVFFGRDDILAIIDKVLIPPFGDSSVQNSTPLRSFALCGMGGMGKTELATQYAHTRKDRFEAIFWLNADDPNILAEQFARMAQDLGLEDKTEVRDLAASRETVKGWLSSPLSRIPGDKDAEDVSWLLIFDNVDNLDVLSDYWPVMGRGSVLITSRDPLAKQTVYTAQDGIDLKPFTVAETMQFIESLTRLKTDSSELLALKQLSDIVDGLPLAIKQVAALLRSSRMTYSDFVRLYLREGAKRLMNIPKISDDGYSSRNMITVWALDRLTPPTRALLQVISLLDPDMIPESVLCQQDLDVELPEYPKDLGDYFDARAELLQSSLIRQVGDERGSLSLHRLVQDSTRASMQNETTVLAYRTALRLTSKVWPYEKHEDTKLVEHISACATYFPCVLRLKDGLEALFSQHPTLSLDAASGELMNDAAWYVFERGLIDVAESFFRLTLKITDNISEKNSPRVQTLIRLTHNGIGTTSAETNRPTECLKHQSLWASMLMTRDESTGGIVSDWEAGIAYNELGVATAYSGDYEKAEEQFLLSIKKYQQNPKYEDTWLGWPMPNLGFVYWVQGRLNEARQVLEEILDIFKLAYGVDDVTSFRTGKMLYGLGNVLEDQELYDESLAVHLRCLKQYVRTIGPVHHRFGDVCVRLARHYMRLKDFSTARSYLDQATLAFNQPWLRNEIVRARYWEGQLLSLMGDEVLARNVLSEAFEARRDLMPADLRPAEALTSKDYDDLVIFWSR